MHHFSRPFRPRKAEGTPNLSQAPQLPVVSPRSSLDRLAPVGGLTTMNQSELFFSTPAAQGSKPDDALDMEHRGPTNYYYPPTSSNGRRSSSSSLLARNTSPPKPPKKGRYYSQALSEEDKQALAYGEQNHNLKAYTTQDMAMHHESRKALVPHGSGVDQLRKMEALASIEKDKQDSQRKLSKKVRRFAVPALLRFKSKEVNGSINNDTHNAQASRSMYDLRSPPTPASPQLSRTFSFDMTPPTLARSAHVRATSSGDYFSRRPVSQSAISTASPSSGTSPRVRSPLVPSASQHRHNPNTTFDSFLVPHKSGKGEAFRGASNAKKVKGTDDARSSSQDRSELPTKEKSSLRRFSKMPSMPLLRKRASRCDIVQNGEDNTS
jgi:hypothetical protein